MGPEPFPSSAVVHADGHIDEIDGTAGGRLVRASPELAGYALALLRSGFPRAAFLWRAADGPWFRVTIERATRGDEADAAVVTLSQERPPHAITERELDVLTLLAGGLNNREIAERLAMGSRTVATHVEHLLMNLSQRTRAGAGAMAMTWKARRPTT